MRQPSAPNLEQVRTALTAEGADFVLLSPLPDSRVHARFIGRFENREVLWDMQLYTLDRYRQARGDVPDTALRGLFRIAPGSEQVYPLEVALNVPIIDEPTLRKTIVMMRNYRQLQFGLNTWAEPDSYAGSTHER